MTKQRKPKKDFKDWEVPKDQEQNFYNLKADLKTTLIKKDNVVMVTFKNMKLTVIEKQNSKKMKTVLEQDFRLGDIGKMRYANKIRDYIHEGYEIKETQDNLDELKKEERKRNKEQIEETTENS